MGVISQARLSPNVINFFATKLTEDEKIVKQVGKSYQKLVFQDMINDPLLASLELKKAETIAPKKKDGLNIEGLTATPKGELLIGFRNPIPDNQALLIPLRNPLDLVRKEKDGLKAEFGEPILLDLKGFGIRSIEYWPTIQSYIIIAGAFDGNNEFTIYSWSGQNDVQPQPVSISLPEDFRPESILFYPHLEDRLQILSDDGAVERIDGKACKDIEDKDNPEKYFRSIWVKLNYFFVN